MHDEKRDDLIAYRKFCAIRAGSSPKVAKMNAVNERQRQLDGADADLQRITCKEALLSEG